MRVNGNASINHVILYFKCSIIESIPKLCSLNDLEMQRYICTYNCKRTFSQNVTKKKKSKNCH